MAGEAQEAKVLYCVEFNAETGTCAVQAWMPAPSLLPPLNAVEVATLLSYTAVAFAVAWAWKQVGRAIRD